MPFALGNDLESNVDELPFSVMARSLRKQISLRPKEAQSECEGISTYCGLVTPIKIISVIDYTIHYTICGAVCFQFIHSHCDDWENIYTLSYYHYQIGSMNYYPLFRVRSWNNGVRCMSFCILKVIVTNTAQRGNGHTLSENHRGKLSSCVYIIFPHNTGSLKCLYHFEIVKTGV